MGRETPRVHPPPRVPRSHPGPYRSKLMLRSCARNCQRVTTWLHHLPTHHGVQKLRLCVCLRSRYVTERQSTAPLSGPALRMPQRSTLSSIKQPEPSLVTLKLLPSRPYTGFLESVPREFEDRLSVRSSGISNKTTADIPCMDMKHYNRDLRLVRVLQQSLCLVEQHQLPTACSSGMPP